MSAETIVLFLITALVIVGFQRSLTRYQCRIEDEHLIITSSYAGIRGWVFRCALSNVESHKYPANSFDLGPLGGHVWGPPWSTTGLVLKLKRPWWFFRRVFVCAENAGEIARELASHSSARGG